MMIFDGIGLRERVCVRERERGKERKAVRGGALISGREVFFFKCHVVSQMCGG